MKSFSLISVALAQLLAVSAYAQQSPLADAPLDRQTVQAEAIRANLAGELPGTGENADFVSSQRAARNQSATPVSERREARAARQAEVSRANKAGELRSNGANAYTW